MDVWLAESGEYEDRHVCGVYSSLAAAERGTKADHGPPYIVEWETMHDHSDSEATLVGNFEAVRGYSIQHRAVYDFTRWTLDVAFGGR